MGFCVLKKKKKRKNGNMVSPLPYFHGLNEEDAEDFCNTFELACLMAKYSDGMMLKIFPLVMRGEARACYNSISKLIKEDWSLEFSQEGGERLLDFCS